MRRSLLSIQSRTSIFLPKSTLPYVCASCQHHALRKRISQFQSTRNASSGLPWTERIRRKIWGTDNPPGLKDPYGAPGFFERRRERARLERRGKVPASVPVNPEPEFTMVSQQPRATTKLRTSRAVQKGVPERADPEYIAAETWDGLEHVGFSGHWSEQPANPTESFRPFLATFEKASTRNDILSALHQAVVEVVTLEDSGSSSFSDLTHVKYTPETLFALSSTNIGVDATSKRIILNYNKDGKESILKAISPSYGRQGSSILVPEFKDVEPASSKASEDLPLATDVGFQEMQMQETGAAMQKTEDHQTSTLLGNEEQLVEGAGGHSNGHYARDYGPQKRIPYTVTYSGFLALPLVSHETLFPIIKRLSQLTGHRIPDPLLTSSKTLMPIYSYLVRDSSPKPEKLADRLLIKHDVASLANLQIMSRRETPVDKDKRLGRWKIIEAELQSKGLPVLSKSRL